MVGRQISVDGWAQWQLCNCLSEKIVCLQQAQCSPELITEQCADHFQFAPPGLPCTAAMCSVEKSDERPSLRTYRPELTACKTTFNWCVEHSAMACGCADEMAECLATINDVANVQEQWSYVCRGLNEEMRWRSTQASPQPTCQTTCGELTKTEDTSLLSPLQVLTDLTVTTHLRFLPVVTLAPYYWVSHTLSISPAVTKNGTTTNPTQTDTTDGKQIQPDQAANPMFGSSTKRSYTHYIQQVVFRVAPVTSDATNIGNQDTTEQSSPSSTDPESDTIVRLPHMSDTERSTTTSITEITETTTTTSSTVSATSVGVDLGLASGDKDLVKVVAILGGMVVLATLAFGAYMKRRRRRKCDRKVEELERQVEAQVQHAEELQKHQAALQASPPLTPEGCHGSEDQPPFLLTTPILPPPPTVVTIEGYESFNLQV
eukprot:TRINITY_DN2395_c0_g1_i1.p1 TRINITY_DN2395_c0_g1~~TRINITY_DN2395_c0_g1_i1.p1  ORF type:complete len:491 (+),score=41.75 TRINITY_DN2395_c0_g1_i1:182-1474(+)